MSDEKRRTPKPIAFVMEVERALCPTMNEFDRAMDALSAEEEKARSVGAKIDKLLKKARSGEFRLDLPMVEVAK